MFDVVIGNPPYNCPGNNKTKKCFGIRISIWPKFARLSLELTDKYLAIITPANWRIGNLTRAHSDIYKKEVWKYKFITVKNCNDYLNLIFK